MEETIKSGKEVISDFFSDIDKLQGVDKNVIEKLLSLHKNEKHLTLIKITNAMEELFQEELQKDEDTNDKDKIN